MYFLLLLSPVGEICRILLSDGWWIMSKKKATQSQQFQTCVFARNGNIRNETFLEEESLVFNRKPCFLSTC